MRILLCGRFDDDDERAQWLAALRDAAPEFDWCEPGDAPDPASIEAAVVANPPPGALQGLPSLRFVQSLWAGVERLVADPTLPAHVPLARMVDPAMNAAMAETALWAVPSLHRGFVDYARQQAAGVWRPLPQRRADEVRVGVLGLGEMGRTAAARIVSLGYRVTGWSATPRPPLPDIAALHGAAALPGVLAESDVVLNLLPLTATTRGLLNADAFARMAPGASLVNLARGAHVVEADLLAALDTGRLAHAVLDVFEVEPLPLGHPFWRHPRVTVLPHAAAATDPRSASAVVARNLRALRDGAPLAHLVDRARGY